jgi:hypothetical protein
MNGSNSPTSSIEDTLEEFPESAPPLPPERAALYRSLDVTRRTSPRRAVATSRPVTVAAAMAESPLLYTNDDNDDDDYGTIEPTATAVVESTLLAPPAAASTRTVTANLNRTGTATSKAPSKKGRSLNFTDDEVDFLLMLIDEEKPTCHPQWEYVTSIFNDKYKSAVVRTTASLKGKFKKLWSDKCPTGSANIPIRVKEAKRIYKDLMGFLSVSNLQVEQAEQNGAASMDTGIRRTTSNMTDDDNTSLYPAISENYGVIQLPGVDDVTTTFSKDANRIVTNRRTPKSAKSNKLPPEFFQMQQAAEIREHEEKKRSDESWEKMIAIVSTAATTIAVENEKSRQAAKEESELRWERMGAMFATVATSIATTVATIYAAQNNNPVENVARRTGTDKRNESPTNDTPNKRSRRY